MAAHPAVIKAFADASFRSMREAWEAHRDSLPPNSRGDHRMDEANETMSQSNKLEVLAHPETIRAARNTLHAADAIRLHHCNQLEQGSAFHGLEQATAAPDQDRAQPAAEEQRRSEADDDQGGVVTTAAG